MELVEKIIKNHPVKSEASMQLMVRLGLEKMTTYKHQLHALRDVCIACAEECSKRETEHCKICAESCRKCAKSCDKILQSLPA